MAKNEMQTPKYFFLHCSVFARVSSKHFVSRFFDERGEIIRIDISHLNKFMVVSIFKTPFEHCSFVGIANIGLV